MTLPQRRRIRPRSRVGLCLAAGSARSSAANEAQARLGSISYPCPSQCLTEGLRRFFFTEILSRDLPPAPRCVTGRLLSERLGGSLRHAVRRCPSGSRRSNLVRSTTASDAGARLAPRRRPRPAARARRRGRRAAELGAERAALELRACVGADAARRCAERASAAQRAEIARPRGGARRRGRPDARNAEYERLWDVDRRGRRQRRLPPRAQHATSGQHVLAFDARARRRRARRRRRDPRARRARSPTAPATARPARELLERTILEADSRGPLLRDPVLRPAAVVEALSYRHLRRRRARRLRAARHAHEPAMGLGNVAVNVVWKLAVVAVYAALYELTPLRLDPATGGSGCCCSSPTTSPTTGSTASATRAACSGPATSSTTRRSTTTSRRRCARRGCR